MHFCWLLIPATQVRVPTLPEGFFNDISMTNIAIYIIIALIYYVYFFIYGKLYSPALLLEHLIVYLANNHTINLKKHSQYIYPVVRSEAWYVPLFFLLRTWKNNMYKIAVLIDSQSCKKVFVPLIPCLPYLFHVYFTLYSAFCHIQIFLDSYLSVVIETCLCNNF